MAPIFMWVSDPLLARAVTSDSTLAASLSILMAA